jgi:hypothetical protein
MLSARQLPAPARDLGESERGRVVPGCCWAVVRDELDAIPTEASLVARREDPDVAVARLVDQDVVETLR